MTVFMCCSPLMAPALIRVVIDWFSAGMNNKKMQLKGLTIFMPRSNQRDYKILISAHLLTHISHARTRSASEKSAGSG